MYWHVVPWSAWLIKSISTSCSVFRISAKDCRSVAGFYIILDCSEQTCRSGGGHLLESPTNAFFFIRGKDKVSSSILLKGSTKSKDSQKICESFFTSEDGKFCTACVTSPLSPSQALRAAKTPRPLALSGPVLLSADMPGKNYGAVFLSFARRIRALLISTPATTSAPPTRPRKGSRSPAMRPKIAAHTGSPA
ncbi:hypothetical protein SAMN02910291_02600 [Desulfovibrio desulfuricans]|uniref:Uncharacterized protein n=1 Tax=Desulfovibrio desulfuricans TaxID=876 RepID=A0AA94L3A6_DESDE|nr:hypothetical protein SAMN02910291_02600 [Desulfovibrio desulfuricans]SPD35312.1 Hypothetical protein DSVG11_1208 [Desulfovibrio sp. G11]